jgi:hypothetical protein
MLSVHSPLVRFVMGTLCAATIWEGCESRTGGSYVRVIYPEVAGAPVISSLRVLWVGEKMAGERMHPGDEISGMMYPHGGGGDITVLLTIGDQKLSWNGRVGKYDDERRYGVEIRLSPIGTIEESHCTHPCPSSRRPWYEPWRSSIRNLWRAARSPQSS